VKPGVARRKGGRRHQQHDREGDEAKADRMQYLREPGKLFEGPRQDNGELKAEQRLTARQHHPRLGQHLLDPHRKRRCWLLSHPHWILP